MADTLSLFHPYIKEWFNQQVGTPTDIQHQAWPLISEGNHILASAPTGSGKTLTAFLWALNQLITGKWESGNIRVLYISPMKALNNDVQKNLIKPLEQLKTFFTEKGEEFPSIKVLTRSGDTPQNERARMKRTPPEILITTPESINIMLTSKGGSQMLTGVKTVILDEVHALSGNKRGTFLITAIERLALLSGEFQRIALSATVSPMDKIAEFIGGYCLSNGTYKKRTVKILQSKESKEYSISVVFPQNAREQIEDGTWWPAITDECKNHIAKNNSTLIFANSRRLIEKITRLINEKQLEPLAYSHHGSLSKEIRLAVEERLKNGDLKAIVATNSLELGIDIGELDAVLMVSTPFSVSSALQRLGRSGHKVGMVSKGILLPIHGRDFIDAAVMAKAIMEKSIEQTRPIIAPLDILAQTILSMTAVENWDIDELYDIVRCAYPFRDLNREHFDLILEMLAGRFADSKISELKSRIFIDKLSNQIESKKGNQYLVYTSGGTIPDRGYFDLRTGEANSKIGELDEEFVWERSIGDTFSLGNNCWHIKDITHNNVFAVATKRAPGIIPFWKADSLNKNFHFSSKAGEFLELANKNLTNSSFQETLMKDYYMDSESSAELIKFLNLQHEITKSSLPHRHNLVVEHCKDSFQSGKASQVILHTLWGGAINRPFALALQAAWQKKYNYRLEHYVENNAIMLVLPHDFSANEIIDLVTSDNLHDLIRLSLEQTGFYGAKFRENAGRALLLPRANFKQRYPLWLNRLRSKKLLDAVSRYPDFPIVLETWRECLNDEFDLENLTMLLEEIKTGEITITDAYTKNPSPFASNLMYRQTNKYMYDDDTPLPGKSSQLSNDLIKEISFNGQIRPDIPGKLILDLNSRLKRTLSGYTPESSADLLNWLVDRILIPQSEWTELTQAIERDLANANEIVNEVLSKVALIHFESTNTTAIIALEKISSLAAALEISVNDLKLSPLKNTQEQAFNKNLAKAKKLTAETVDIEDLVLQFLIFYGPVETTWVASCFGFNKEQFYSIEINLLKREVVIIDKISESSTENQICHIENLEILLRMLRRSKRPEFDALDAQHFQLFLADYHGITNKGSDTIAMQNAMEQLFGYTAAAELWEESILPARLESYYSSWLDSLMQSSELIWFGCGNKKITFSFYSDLDLFNFTPKTKTGSDNILSDNQGKIDLFNIAKQLKISTAEASKKLWQSTWNGEVSNQSFNAIRKGITNKFSPAEIDSSQQGRRGGFNRWISSRPIAGDWYSLNRKNDDGDAIAKEELVKDRIRILFQRYGILFREILENENTGFKWSDIFKTLRLMELSGEITTGYFFKGIPGIQFISHEAFRFLQKGLDYNSIYWINAKDPVSLCGIKCETLRKEYPKRIQSNFIVFHGTKLVAVIERNGKSIKFNCKPGDREIEHYLQVFKDIMNRDFNPVKSIEVDTINNIPAKESPFAMDLKKFGFKQSYKGLKFF